MKNWNTRSSKRTIKSNCSRTSLKRCRKNSKMSKRWLLIFRKVSIKDQAKGQATIILQTIIKIPFLIQGWIVSFLRSYQRIRMLVLAGLPLLQLTLVHRRRISTSQQLRDMRSVPNLQLWVVCHNKNSLRSKMTNWETKGRLNFKDLILLSSRWVSREMHKNDCNNFISYKIAFLIMYLFA